MLDLFCGVVNPLPPPPPPVAAPAKEEAAVGAAATLADGVPTELMEEMLALLATGCTGRDMRLVNRFVVSILSAAGRGDTPIGRLSACPTGIAGDKDKPKADEAAEDTVGVSMMGGESRESGSLTLMPVADKSTNFSILSCVLNTKKIDTYFTFLFSRVSHLITWSGVWPSFSARRRRTWWRLPLSV